MTAPPRPETNSRVDGFPLTNGRNKCGTTNPTKPIAPQTAVAAPTEEATPNTRSNFVFVNEMDNDDVYVPRVLIQMVECIKNIVNDLETLKNEFTERK